MHFRIKDEKIMLAFTIVCIIIFYKGRYIIKTIFKIGMFRLKEIRLKEILVLVGLSFVVLLILIAYKEHKLENFATLQSAQLLALMNNHLESEQELSRNIVATAQAEVDEGQRDVELAIINERTAQEQLNQATTELTKRRTNIENIRTKLTTRIPPT